MLQDWISGPVGNSNQVMVGAAKRETLAQVMVRAFRRDRAGPAVADRPRAA